MGVLPEGDGEDVYDVIQYVWCSLCEAAHEPCELDEDGVEPSFWLDPMIGDDDDAV